MESGALSSPSRAALAGRNSVSSVSVVSCRSTWQSQAWTPRAFKWRRSACASSACPSALNERFGSMASIFHR
eukprot:scaffold2872_cov112-Isochrysis_galbana.AAC.6